MAKEEKEKIAQTSLIGVWVVKSEFRDKDNFNKVHEVGDEVEHTENREKLGLIELK